MELLAAVAATEAGCGWGANWAGPHLRAPELRSASCGSEDAAAAADEAGAALPLSSSRPPSCGPGMIYLYFRTDHGASLLSMHILCNGCA